MQNIDYFTAELFVNEDTSCCEIKIISFPWKSTKVENSKEVILEKLRFMALSKESTLLGSMKSAHILEKYMQIICPIAYFSAYKVL